MTDLEWRRHFDSLNVHSFNHKTHSFTNRFVSASTSFSDQKSVLYKSLFDIIRIYWIKTRFSNSLIFDFFFFFFWNEPKTLKLNMPSQKLLFGPEMIRQSIFTKCWNLNFGWFCGHYVQPNQFHHPNRQIIIHLEILIKFIHNIISTEAKIETQYHEPNDSFELICSQYKTLYLSQLHNALLLLFFSRFRVRCHSFILLALTMNV